MYDEDFLLGLDGMGADGALMGDRGGGGYLTEQQEEFYNKLGEYNSNWLDLEGLSYKCSKIGQLNTVGHIKQMSEVPDI